MIQRVFAVIGVFLLSSLSQIAHAELEVGLGLTAAHVPHYIGSDEGETYVIPFPYLRYRSDKLTIDRNLIQGNLWQAGNWSLELSFGGAVKVDSDESQARQGMDDLDFIIEAGPALHYYFLGNRRQDNALFFELPVRLATSTDFTQARYRGFTVNPRVVWRRGYFINGYEIRPQLSMGVRSANANYHDYIYGVENRDITPDRNQYEASDGFGGYQIAYSTAVLWHGWLAAGFVRYVNISDASFLDSPLVDTQHNLTGGIAFAYLFEN
ncbi:MipA/OmpV family protein [Bermanella sp. R86510]|uniref:MipA/OmpV family protein n=1 Tax=unclassified Bermanella TaxID=2627862 RepID=UPI0037C5D685